MSATFSSIVGTGTGSSLNFATGTSAPSQSLGSAGFPAATAFASSSPMPAAGDSFDPLGLPSFDSFLDLYSTLNAALGLLLFGLLFSAMCVGCMFPFVAHLIMMSWPYSAFGAVCTKAMIYARQGSGLDGIVTKLIVSAFRHVAEQTR